MAIHNRSQPLTQHEQESLRVEEKAEDARGFLPTEAEMKRAMKLHKAACDFKSVALGIKGISPGRAATLEKRARLMQVKAALILLGEERSSEDED